MIEYFKKSPSKLLTRIYLVVGLIIFVAIYSYMMKLFQGFVFTTEEYNKVWLSFDAEQYRGLIQSVIQTNQMAMFKNVFVLNIISVSALAFVLFALSLIIAHSFKETSKLYKVAYLFPVFPILITLLDIIPSLCILFTNLAEFPSWLAYVVSGGYVIRVILLYILFIWFLYALIRFIIQKFKK